MSNNAEMHATICKINTYTAIECDFQLYVFTKNPHEVFTVGPQNELSFVKIKNAILLF